MRLSSRLLSRVLALCAGFAPSPTHPGEPTPAGGFLFLTYNVAGLPDAISGSTPSVNHPQISPLLNAYDLVVVQEDFYYDELLSADAEHPYQSGITDDWEFLRPGDGLARFSTLPFAKHTRVPWNVCFGIAQHANDCLTDKGFSYAATLVGGVRVDVYILHMDAANANGDQLARRIQMKQLIATIESQSAGHALIVAGDTNLNLNNPADAETLDLLMSSTGLQDVCRYVGCSDDGRIDRVLFRDGEHIDLEPVRYWIPPEFIDDEGQDLSDHEPVAVEFQWVLADDS